MKKLTIFLFILFNIVININAQKSSNCKEYNLKFNNAIERTVCTGSYKNSKYLKGFMWSKDLEIDSMYMVFYCDTTPTLLMRQCDIFSEELINSSEKYVADCFEKKANNKNPIKELYSNKAKCSIVFFKDGRFYSQEILEDVSLIFANVLIDDERLFLTITHGSFLAETLGDNKKYLFIESGTFNLFFSNGKELLDFLTIIVSDIYDTE